MTFTNISSAHQNFIPDAPSLTTLVPYNIKIRLKNRLMFFDINYAFKLQK